MTDATSDLAAKLRAIEKMSKLGNIAEPVTTVRHLDRTLANIEKLSRPPSVLDTSALDKIINRPHLEVLGSAQRLLDNVQSSQDRVQDLIERLSAIDVTSTYTPILAATESSNRLQQMFARLHVQIPYEKTISALFSDQDAPDLDIDGGFAAMTADIDQPDFDLAAGLELVHVVVDALGRDDVVDADDLADAVEAAVHQPPSEGVRLYAAVYLSVLFFAICAACYFTYPDAAGIVLDATTPATWAIAVGGFVYRGLGSHNEDTTELEESGQTSPDS